jgi:hypothetical protein
VEALAVKLTQSEGELIQEKFEVKKLVNFLKQVLFEISSFSIEICFFPLGMEIRSRVYSIGF